MGIWPNEKRSASIACESKSLASLEPKSVIVWVLNPDDSVSPKPERFRFIAARPRNFQGPGHRVCFLLGATRHQHAGGQAGLYRPRCGCRTRAFADRRTREGRVTQ